jgi:hypothetical protein
MINANSGRLRDRWNDANPIGLIRRSLRPILDIDLDAFHTANAIRSSQPDAYQSPAKTIPDLIAKAKANPGSVSFGSSGHRWLGAPRR